MGIKSFTTLIPEGLFPGKEVQTEHRLPGRPRLPGAHDKKLSFSLAK
jgi:hypothetical protein